MAQVSTSPAVIRIRRGSSAAPAAESGSLSFAFSGYEPHPTDATGAAVRVGKNSAPAIAPRMGGFLRVSAPSRRASRKGIEVVRHMLPFWKPDGEAELGAMLAEWWALCDRLHAKEREELTDE